MKNIEPGKPTKLLQFLSITALAALITAVVYSMREYNISAKNISLATTIGTVGTLLWLTKRYGTRSIAVLTFMMWVIIAIILLTLAPLL